MSIIDTVIEYMDNPTSKIGWVVAPLCGEDGSVRCTKVARVIDHSSKSGQTRTIIITSWFSPSGERLTDAVHCVGMSRGGGYDMFIAATAGLFLLGRELGNECDHLGRPSFYEVRTELEARGYVFCGC